MDDTNLTPEQAEALIAGTSSDPSTEDLATVIAALRTYQHADIDEDLVNRLVTAATGHIADSKADLPLESTGRLSILSVSRQSLRRQIAAVATTVTLVFASGTSVAVAADRASPGDALYGIDRALENIGIGHGGTQERLDEAETLVSKGDVAGGLEHAALALATATDDEAPDGQQGASAALHEAAERARETQSTQNGTTKAGVAALLEYLSGNIGHVDGSMVAELAHEIGNGNANNASGSNATAPGQTKKDPDSESSSPGNAPEEPPGQTKKDSESPPANQGNSADEPPGQSDASDPGSSSSNPGNSPDSPPGQSNGSNPGNSPDEPPGQSKKNSEDSSKPGKTK